jgi:hypothetical protein
MPCETLPEKELTPTQRGHTWHSRRSLTRTRQWVRAEKWKFLQEREHDWVCLDRLADWCSRRPGDVERDPLRRTQTFDDLQQSIVDGEFTIKGRCKVIYLQPAQSYFEDRVKLRLDPGRIQALGVPLHHVVDLCWAPRELCIRWLLARGIVLPPWLITTPLQLTAARARATSAPLVSATAPSPSRATEHHIHDAITAVYAATKDKKPPNVKELVPLVKAELRAKNLTATCAIIQHCAKDPRHAGKRWLQGDTRKSKQIPRADE